MGQKHENLGFRCLHCGEEVKPVTNGSFRNHCPFCLYSIHLDVLPGDRKNPCRGMMEPIGIRFHSKKGYQIVHKCQNCGAQQITKTAVDTQQPDNFDLILELPVFS